MVGTADGQDERRLIEAAQADPRRFLDLYDRHFHRVYAYGRRRAGNRADAEDITADVFHRALEHLNQFEWRGTPFVAWLFRIASHALADHWARLRQGSGWPEHAGREGGTRLGAMPASDPEFERQVMLFQLVERLPDEQRRVIELRFGEGRSIRDTATIVSKSEGAVKQLQLRALQNLRKAMEAQHG